MSMNLQDIHSHKHLLHLGNHNLRSEKAALVKTCKTLLTQLLRV